MSEFWASRKVAVLGGAGMIGSHLAEALIAENVKDLWIADDLSSGKRENLPKGIHWMEYDLRDPTKARSAVWQADVVFQLAAQNGGRAFVDTHELECYQNFELDTSVFRACADQQVSKVFYMSSACAYDTSIQQDVTEDLKLSESLIDYGKPIVPDGSYGEEKYIAEKILHSYTKRGLFHGVAARGFTVYGPRVSTTLFIGAAIAKTYTKQDPLVIFGDGLQRRNWTMVRDVARGIILTAEKMENGVVNIGTEETNNPNIVYGILWDMFGWKPQAIEYRKNALVGTANRIADASKAKAVLGWEPEYNIRTGLEATVEWFTRTYTVDQVRDGFEKKLFER